MSLSQFDPGNVMTDDFINYCDKDGKTEEQFNPNGSIKNIAGIFNKEKNGLA